MADVTKEIALEVSLKDSTSAGTQSAKQRLREMQKELIAMAEAGQQGTDAFKRLEQQAGQLKDEIGDVNQRIKNLSSDTKNIDAFVEAVQGISAGFQIAQGAAALFGDENEDLQKAMLKVQGAMALANGVQQISILLQKESAVMMKVNAAATNLYAVVVGTATGAMRAFRIALAATGIGAVVVVLGLAAEAMGLFSTKTEDAADSQKDLKRSLEDTAGTLEYYERKLKANGATEADLAKLRRQTLLNEKAELDRKLQEDVARYGVRNDKYQNSLRQELDLLNIKIKEESQIIDADAKQRADKAAQGQKQTTDKATQLANELLAIQKKYQDQLALLNADGLRRELLAIDQKYEADLAKLKANNKSTADLEAVIAKEKLEKEKEFGIQLIDVQQVAADRQKEAADKQEQDNIAIMQRNAARRKTDLETEIAIAEKKKAIDKEVAEQRAENIKQVMVGLNALADLAKASSAAEVERADRAKEDEILALDRQLKDKLITQEFYEQQKAAITDKYDKEAEKYERKQFELNKAAGIANAMVNTYLAATQVLATTKGGTVARFVAMAATITAGLAQVAVISKQQFRGRTAGKMSATEAISGGGGSSTATPSPTFSNPNTTMLGTDGAALNANQANQPMRAYVVERDIQQTTSRVRRLSEFATLG
jgi:hypothetical protein